MEVARLVHRPGQSFATLRPCPSAPQPLEIGNSCQSPNVAFTARLLTKVQGLSGNPKTPSRPFSENWRDSKENGKEDANWASLVHPSVQACAQGDSWAGDAARVTNSRFCACLTPRHPGATLRDLHHEFRARDCDRNGHDARDHDERLAPRRPCPCAVQDGGRC